MLDAGWRAGLTAALLSVTVMSSVALAQSLNQQYPDQPQFRDPKTGQIWTPENVGVGRSGPNTPQDRAFNPQGQTVVPRGVAVQTPNVTPLGSIPITAGPTTPIATIDDASLTAIPSQRWQVVLYLNNNSAGVINPVVECRFTNGGNVVLPVQANLPPINPGTRVGLTIYGPETNLFVDRADCSLAQPR
jgi:hypothetical protein